jgi:hypothetical protein
MTRGTEDQVDLVVYSEGSFNHKLFGEITAGFYGEYFM